MEVSGNMEEKILPVLPYHDFECYYDALQNNNTIAVASVLSGAGDYQRKALLNGPFDFGGASLVPANYMSRMSRPLLISVMTGSVKVMELLLKEGADIHQTNTHGENIIHSLVAASSLNLICTEEAIKTYKKLVSVLDSLDLEKLLLQENKTELRPLEMAANLGCVSLLETILLTCGVYLMKTIKRGSFMEEWIDVTDYETDSEGTRKAMSPLSILSHMDTQCAFTGKYGEITKCNIVKLWLEKEVKMRELHILSAFILTILYFMIYLLFITNVHNVVWEDHNDTEYDKMEDTADCRYEFFFFTIPNAGRLGCLIFLLLWFGLFSTQVICGWNKKGYRMMKLYSQTLLGTKDKVVRHHFFDVMYTCTAASSIMFLILTAVDHPSVQNISHFIVIISCVTTVWNVLYFLQISSILGHFTIAMQRMVWVLVQFLILHIIMLMPFVFCWYRLLKGSNGCPNEHFSSNFVEHFYNVFVLSLNMIDLTQFKDENVLQKYHILLFLHVIYIFLAIILLLNFLIALLSASVAEVMEHKETIMLLQKMNVITIIDFVMVKWPGYNWLWRKRVEKQFEVENGRVYLVKVSFCKDSSSCLNLNHS